MIKYSLISLFIIITYWLSFKGMKKTKDIKSFSIGNKDLNPMIVGITLAASISSTATFVINPGFVYIHGLSAFLHYGIAASLGILVAFILLSKKFRKFGEKSGAITIPDWIYHKYQNRQLSLFFAFINLVSITFVVLILVGCSLLMSSLFGISQHMALTLCFVFVLSYVLIGGSYAHIYTNTFQGILMVLISGFIFIHGLQYFDGGFMNSLQSVSLNYASVFNAESILYYDFISVFLSGFVITFALMLQPHILTKVLYIKSDKDVNKFLLTTFSVGIVFSLMLFVGFYAKLAGLEVLRQDAVVASYINHAFKEMFLGELLLSFISITLLAAGLSTLDGILVSLSSMVVNDIYKPLSKNNFNEKTALRYSRITLVAIGLVSFALAWNPPKLVGLFAQKGVYALAAASVVPICFGVFSKLRLSSNIILVCGLIGFFGHLYLNIFGGIANPAVSSMYSMMASLTFLLFSILVATLSNISKQKGYSL